MFEVNFEILKEKIKLKFSVLWPSTKSTPPTEANISTIFTEIYSEKYFCYSEVPIVNGRIDLVLVEKSQKEIVYCEFKSSKPNSLNEIKADIDRLLGLSTKSMYYYLRNTPTEPRRVIFQWSENQDEIDRNIEILSKTYPQISFQKNIIDCEGAPLYCLISVW